MRTLTSTVDVGRPVHEVYDAWSAYERFPEFMKSVAAVEKVDHQTSHWVVTIARERREFDAVVVDEQPGDHIAWESTGAAPHEGLVHFRPLDDASTRVTVVLSWQPQGLFDKLGDRFGLVARDVQQELERFRARLDPAGQPPNGSAPPKAVKEADRGRQADSPTEIPAPGWRDIVKRTVKQLKSDNVPIISAGVAFFFFLALLPALAAVIGVYGIVADPNDVTRQLGDYLGALPRDAADFLEAQITEITKATPGGLGLGVAISVVGALWSASKGMQALITALNIAYDEDETRKFFRLRLLSLLLTVGGIAVAVIGIGGMAVLGSVAADLGGPAELVVSIVRWPVLAALLMGMLAILYRYAPDRDAPKWRWVTPGAVTAVVLWVLASFGFSVYVNNFGSYNETYGTLAAIVVLLLWLYLSAYIIVFGAEFDAEAERQTARDSTVGHRQPLGARRAYAADTVASSPD